jgi:UDP-N-acetylglucosamine:LPS N-acetylglucosamine transferase
LDIIKQLLEDQDKLKKMSSMSRSLARPDAARKILELIYETV